MKRIFVAAGLIVLLGLNSAGQAPPSGAASVLVDVIVEKDGISAADLAPEDFEVLVDGKKVILSSLKRILPGVADGQEYPYPKRLAVVFHDLNYSASGIKPQDEQELAAELVALADGGVEIMLLQLDRFHGLSVLQAFTRKEARIREAAAKAVNKTGVDSFTDYSFADLKRWVFLRTVGGLISACSVLKNTPGRKSLLLISSGIPDLSSFNPSEVQSGNLAGLSRNLLEHEDRLEIDDPFNVFGGEKLRSGDEVLRKTIEFVNALNISVYALDPGVFASTAPLSSTEYLFDSEKRDVEARARTQADDSGKRYQNLRFLSEGTGGIYFRGANKYAELRQKLGADLGSYYALRIAPVKSEGDNAYHKITVKAGRQGLEVRARKGYRRFSAEDEKNLLLSGAFYGPELFQDVPFLAEFIPLIGKSGSIEPWIGIALLLQQIFGPGTPETGTRALTLHVSLEEIGGEAPGFRGKYGLPIKVTPDFIASLSTRKYLWLYFKGPDVIPVGKKYRAIYVLYDETMAKAGAWTSIFTRPDTSAGQKGALLNCVLGSPGKEPPAGEAAFSLNPKTGILEYGPLMFYPRITGQFSASQDAFVFLQIFSPAGRDTLYPEFQIEGPGPGSRTVPGETIAESWDEKTKVWSGLIKLRLAEIAPGGLVLRVAIPGPASDERFVRRIPLMKLAI